MPNATLPIQMPTSDATTVEVFGNCMLPLYRHGDRLIVSGHTPIKVGDRVILRTIDNNILGGTLTHRTRQQVAINVGGSSRKDVVIEASTVEFLGRVIWASQ